MPITSVDILEQGSAGRGRGGRKGVQYQFTSVDYLERERYCRPQRLRVGGGGRGSAGHPHLWTYWTMGLEGAEGSAVSNHTCRPTRPMVGFRGGESAGANHTCGPT